MIRAIEPSDAPAIRGIVRQVFSPFVRTSFHLTPHTLVAIDGDRLCAGVVLKLVDSKRYGRIGIISWIFVAPGYEGRGIASLLRDAALDVLGQNGCDCIVANIDRENTRSANLFRAAGFEPLGPGALLSVFGWGLFRVLRHTTHILDPGYALFVRRTGESLQVATQPVMQLVATLVLHVPLVMLLLLRTLASPEWSPVMTYRLSAVVAVLILVRLAAMRAVSLVRRLPVRYHMWESGFLLSAGAAGLFGFLMPVTGSLYPASRFWSVREYDGPLASMALAGLFPVAVLTLLAVWLSGAVSHPEALAWVWWVRRAGAWFLLTDGLLPFYPFTAYNAARIFRWSRIAWICTAGLSLAVAIVAMVW